MLAEFLFYGSAAVFAGGIIYCLERWKVPIEKWRHEHFGTEDSWRM